MYPVRLGFGKALKRIRALIKNGHHAEALVTSVFTLEKTMRRTMKIILLRRGFSVKEAERLIDRKTFGELREMWNLFEKDHRTLPALIGDSNWQAVPRAVEMRNKLVHGAKVFKLADCKNRAELVLNAIRVLRERAIAEYGLDPWQQITGWRRRGLTWYT